ncbi:hypothetical protein HGG75_24215 [Ochrobactrum pseudogrignonense]|nr:hypothetical protein [Brucella pseudogrignonensis]
MKPGWGAPVSILFHLALAVLVFYRLPAIPCQNPIRALMSSWLTRPSMSQTSPSRRKRRSLNRRRLKAPAKT